ncbi:GDP-6-deoxy-D-talose 4-dehydrogenase [Marinobacterium sp. xm-g-59]|uniref:NAD-dependent epimerase/dehydratase family protein n=1 Tax=Marinobacterium sp. xm-g-59 TaxID=2497748 RepID=UPI0015688309|nr:NAD(P)-dependent oxidoreductase [Marinobacterium sp. xm-g-59]NRP95477.1 GDP-6-deoxy-D-talose 4-dehydrogenase [Marinobacterium sp. xm-g-59]
MKVLLTGASGFIGTHLLMYLLKKLGHDSVVALTSNKIPSINSITYDNEINFGLDKGRFDDITHIIHAGAFIPKDASQANDIEKCFGNIGFTTELLSYDFINLEKVINLSTIDIYAVTTKSLSEQSKIDPVSLYGSSKLYCESMIKSFSRQRDLDFLNLRIGHVYGPGEEKYKKVLPNAIQNLLENKPLELWGDGCELRSYIFIQDVVQAVANSLNSCVRNIDINIVSGVAVSIKDILEKAIEISGKKVKINRRNSSHQKRDLVFDNGLLLSTLLDKETELIKGLKIEYQYMKEKYESSI